MIFADFGLQAGAMLGIALTTSPVVAAVMLGLSSFTSGIGNVIVITLRQAAVPDHLLGRVTSAYRLVGLGALSFGGLAGGLLARFLDLTAPFFAAAGGLALLAVVVAPFITTSAYQDAIATGDTPSTTDSAPPGA